MFITRRSGSSSALPASDSSLESSVADLAAKAWPEPNDIRTRGSSSNRAEADIRSTSPSERLK